ncbi:hypothetical protein BX600DRAFT_435772 [Xylariales sp. PMI_506]|nr:hypothetical protein BX600DRAFT_435772 [Xylariales sp. PMI_506]
MAQARGISRPNPEQCEAKKRSCSWACRAKRATDRCEGRSGKLQLRHTGFAYASGGGLTKTSSYPRDHLDGNYAVSMAFFLVSLIIAGNPQRRRGKGAGTPTRIPRRYSSFGRNTYALFSLCAPLYMAICTFWHSSDPIDPRRYCICACHPFPDCPPVLQIHRGISALLQTSGNYGFGQHSDFAQARGISTYRISWRVPLQSH